jgi:putative transcriptional regulator
MSKFGDELVKSAKQALEFAKGEADEGEFRDTAVAAIDVKAVRAKLKLTRPEFARRFGIELSALEAWELTRSARPDFPVAIF